MVNWILRWVGQTGYLSCWILMASLTSEAWAQRTPEPPPRDSPSMMRPDLPPSRPSLPPGPSRPAPSPQLPTLIIPDDTLGETPSQINSLDSRTLQIEGGATRGRNLFHSFQEFSVVEGQSILFSNPVEIDNILTRITGTEPSQLAGQLTVLGNANLFLLNPNGILVQEGIRLDVQGSVVFATADALQFDEQGQFSAIAPELPTLLTIQPSALLFNSRLSPSNAVSNAAAPAGIDLSGGLAFRGMGNFIVAGGELNFQNSRISTGGGDIDIAALGGPTIAPLIWDSNAPNLSLDSTTVFAPLSLTEDSSISVGGVNSGRLQLWGSQIILQRTFLGSETNLNGNGRGIVINASESLQLLAPRDDFTQRSDISTENIGTGQGGSITINAPLVRLTGWSSITADAENSGPAGGIEINAQEVQLLEGATVTSGNRIFIAVPVPIEQADAPGGALIINASDQIQIEGTRDVSAFPDQIDNFQIAGGLFSAATGDGRAGDIRLSARQITVAKGSRIDNSTFGSGDGGTLQLRATDSITLQGQSVDGVLPSGLFTQTLAEEQAGNAGTIEIQTPRLNLQNGALISSATTGSGQGGNIELKIDDGRIGSAAQLSVESQGSAPAGRLEIVGNSLVLSDRAQILATTTSASGGDIFLDLNRPLLLRDNSAISATAGTAQAGGDGGNIQIQTPFVIGIPSENSDITANAFSGQGGEIEIDTFSVLGFLPRSRSELENALDTTEPSQLDPSQLISNDITAISQVSPTLNGLITINDLDVDPAEAVAELPDSPVDAAGLIDQNLCEVTEGSTFVVTGRGGLQKSPTGIVGAIATWEDWRIQPPDAPSIRTNPPPTANTPSIKHSQIIEAQGWQQTSRGTVYLSSQPTIPIPQPRVLGLPDCRSHSAS